MNNPVYDVLGCMIGGEQPNPSLLLTEGTHWLHSTLDCSAILPCATPSYHNLLRPTLAVSTKHPTTTFFVLHWIVQLYARVQEGRMG